MSFLDLPQHPIEFGGFQAKAPLFYPEVRMMGGIFTADFHALSSALGKGPFRPLKMLPSVGLVGIHCLEYVSSDIGPYNEISLSIALKPKGIAPASLKILKSVLKNNFDAQIVDLPVTTEIALQGGLIVFNYPKYLADISFRETAHHRVCTLRDLESKDLIFEFSGRKISTKSRKKNILTLNSFPKKDQAYLNAKTQLNCLESGTSFLVPNATLRMGTHPHAEIYKNLKIGNLVQYFFVPKAQGILFEPEVSPQ